MRIELTSIIVNDQAKAEAFYTDVLGFVKHKDIASGDYRWLTVVSTEDPEGPELLLEPNENPAAQTYQRALYDQGIPIAALASSDVAADHERLSGAGVRFHQPPTPIGQTVYAIFDDTCGNFIQLYQS